MVGDIGLPQCHKCTKKIKYICEIEEKIHL